MTSFSLVTWNVNFRYLKLVSQTEKLRETLPDIVCLQEITPRSHPAWISFLRDTGYEVHDSYSEMDDISIARGMRRSGLIIASKFPLKPLKIKINIPWRERILSTVINSPFGNIELHNVHMPSGSSHGYIKVETFEGIYRALAKEVEYLRILCGDFNSPKAETIKGETIPFGNKRDARWREAEMSIIRGLAKFNLEDVYRKCNGYSNVEVKSWMRQNRGKYHGCRLDHIFASKQLNAKECHYDTDVIFSGLSDHAIMSANFEL